MYETTPNIDTRITSVIKAKFIYLREEVSSHVNMNSGKLLAPADSAILFILILQANHVIDISTFSLLRQNPYA